MSLRFNIYVLQGKGFDEINIIEVLLKEFNVTYGRGGSYDIAQRTHLMQ